MLARHSPDELFFSGLTGFQNFLGGGGGGGGGEKRGSSPQPSLERAPPVVKIGLTAEKG